MGIDRPQFFFAVLALCFFSCAACGRVIHQEPPAKPDAAEPADPVEVDLPAGARCRSADAQPDIWPGAEASCTADPTWPTWSEVEPPGICYELDKPCAGLDDHVAYLTFDDGPVDWTPEILDTLAANDVRATFFVNARSDDAAAGLDRSFRDDAGREQRYRDVLARIVMEGHALGNHTRDHADLGDLSAAQVELQLADDERLVNEALLRAGVSPRPLTLFRPPFGAPWAANDALADPAAQRAVVGRVVMRFGYNVLWNIDSSDSKEWAPGEASTFAELRSMRFGEAPQEYLAKVSRLRSTVLEDALVQAGAGVVILMHDTHNTTRDALPDIITGLRAAGYRFATLEDQVSEQFDRTSLQLTPGPALGLTCGEAERARSCKRFADNAFEVCGRLWLAFEQLGGEALLGKPLGVPKRADVYSQTFERGSIELHPEWAAPCDVVFVPAE
jgi:peptidoglycan/xylan/chitin deacetylase (PgdA/CDA1 family)